MPITIVQQQKEIIKWFKMVCNGIRQEYEQGASPRKLEVDITTLKKLLYAKNMPTQKPNKAKEIIDCLKLISVL